MSAEVDIALDSIFCVVYIASTILYVIRRNIQPLKVRSLSNTISAATGIFLLSAFRNVYLVVGNCFVDPTQTLPVNFFEWFSFDLYYIIYVALVLRVYRVETIFRWADFIKKQDEISIDSFRKFKNRISERTITKIFFISFCILCFLSLITSFGSILSGKLQCVESISVAGGIVAFAYAILVIFAFCLIFLWFWFKLRNQPKDVYFLKYEMILLAVYGIILWVVYTIIQFFVLNTFLLRMLVRFYFLGIFFIVVGLPLILSYFTKPKINSKISNESSNNLIATFQQEDLKKLFLDFLVKSLSIENFLFYEEVEKLKKRRSYCTN